MGVRRPVGWGAPFGITPSRSDTADDDVHILPDLGGQTGR